MSEDILKDFGVDPEKIYDGSSLHPIPLEWIHEIIENSINSVEFPKPIGTNFSKTNRIITLIFTDTKRVEEFENKFNSSIPKVINKVIQSKGEKPKEYNRALVTQTTINDGVFTISY